VLNGEAVRMAVRSGCAIGAPIAPHSVFARKNYFYPDLPKGYQISQYELPIVARGALDIRARGRYRKRIGVTACTWRRTPASRCTKVCRGVAASTSTVRGTPLIEIVSEPDLRSAKEAVRIHGEGAHA
jgi:aspartyl-tRNA(Asn)/glutamyl-tRNA(Gln) amidotransferase subunit B